MPKDHSAALDLPVASLGDRLAFIAGVAGPTVAKGPLVRRPRVLNLADRFDMDARAVRRMADLRRRYGEGPLLVPIPGRLHAVLLSPDHARDVLERTPDPFTPATDEKRRALSHFEPHVSLISFGRERTERRRFNEAVLEEDRPVHSMAGPVLEAARQEARRLLEGLGDRLDWETFFAAWYALVRRVVLGEGARTDTALTDLLERLRFRGNWVMLARQRDDLIADLRARINRHLDRADPGSLAARIAALPKGPDTQPADQVAHYLFAFDPGGMAAFRALAVLSTHTAARDRALDEVRAAGADRSMLPSLRAALLESLRLWPTTPVILRQTTREVILGPGTLPEGTNVILYAPFFHRDEALPFANRYAPELWLDEERGVRTIGRPPFALVPFSAGPGRCPAADFVPMTASAFLAELLEMRRFRLRDRDDIRPDRRLPGTLDHRALAFEVVA
ncbi:cytochrome P450 [Rubellimicrobium sp. CFH 75288]|uniref:cytochrome P450 n=1 Tax=Rubellimicrobium sp. CFH 75288 TaxID=2697034 RepID=UPI001412F60D|nr:cytochrome P450 [Rubellimicrobium sp. CFH 75288]NAZ37482.1 cytochrome P450 [Rubellimicrobium sp. CFH 75288]